MRKLLGLFLLIATTSVQAAVILPTVRIWAVPNALGGTYTISVDSTQSDFNGFIDAFAVTTNSTTTGVEALRTGWGADLLTSTEWDAGEVYEQTQFEDTDPPITILTTGSQGVGSYAGVFGGGTHAAVFWTDNYTGTAIGPNNTSSSFNWFGPGSTTAFVQLSGVQGGTVSLACADVGDNLAVNPAACTALLPQVPLPAAAWLFGSALLGLAVVARRRRI